MNKNTGGKVVMTDEQFVDQMLAKEHVDIAMLRRIKAKIDAYLKKVESTS